MTISSLTISVLLVAAATYLSPVGAFTVAIPWGLTPAQIYAYRISNPAYKPPHATPHKVPTKVPTKPHTAPTALKKPPPPSPAPAPPSPATFAPPPPAPVSTGRRSLLASKYLYPYRYLVQYSSSAHTYKFKTLKITHGTKLLFEVGLAGSKGHHGLARTSSKYRCGHALETYFRGVKTRKNFTVTLPHKGTYHFYDPTLSPVAKRNSKGKLIKYVPEQRNCQSLFISLTVSVH